MGRLPSEATSFIGRQRELAELEEPFGLTRILTEKGEAERGMRLTAALFHFWWFRVTSRKGGRGWKHYSTCAPWCRFGTRFEPRRSTRSGYTATPTTPWKIGRSALARRPRAYGCRGC